MTVNNGKRVIAKFGNFEGVVGFVAREEFAEFSYLPPTKERPQVGVGVMVDGVDFVVVSVTPSKMVPGYIVVRVK
jgi:hypothetical protein